MFILSSLVEKSTASYFDMGLQLLFLIVMFAIVLLIAYYTTRFVAGAKLKNMKKSNMQIIETISIGFNNIHIVKVCEQYFLVSSSKEGIRMLTEIKGQDLVIEEGIKAPQFEKYLKNYVESFKTKNGGKDEK